MAILKKANGKKLYWYPGEVGPEQMLISELVDQDFPLQLEKSVEQQDCTIVHKFEIRITKKGGLAMHHMGMNVKRKTDNNGQSEMISETASLPLQNVNNLETK